MWSLLLLSVPTVLLAHAPDLDHLHGAARHAGRADGGGLHADAGASGRALLTARRRRRLRRLHHRQCREQSDWPAGRRRACRSFWPGRRTSTSSPRSTPPAACWSFSPSSNARTMGAPMMPPAPWTAFGAHLANPALRTAFAIGFLILFAFIGVFTYVNFVLVRAPVRDRDDEPRARLFRLSAVDHHDAARRAAWSQRSARASRCGLASASRC